MSLGLKRNMIVLMDHDPKWEELAKQTVQLLWKIFGPAAKDVQHIGSTAIKTIKAKPIIDIAVAVDHFNEFELLIPDLERNGFSYRGWFIAERITVLNVYDEIKTGETTTTHHIHVVKVGSKEWNDHIRFRDYLNTHPSAAKTYEEIKTKLASKRPYDEDRKKYNEGKNEFIKQTLIEAAAWIEKK